MPLPEGVRVHPMTLGDHIKKARFERRLKQIDVARILNVDYSTVRRWEENEVKITLLYLERITKFLESNIS